MQLHLSFNIITWEEKLSGITRIAPIFFISVPRVPSLAATDWNCSTFSHVFTRVVLECCSTMITSMWRILHSQVLCNLEGALDIFCIHFPMVCVYVQHFFIRVIMKFESKWNSEHLFYNLSIILFRKIQGFWRNCNYLIFLSQTCSQSYRLKLNKDTS